MSERDYLDYYEENKIIPTLSLSELDEKILINQRKSFYFKVGISQQEFINKEVLELGPGTGYNAYYLIKYAKIKNITLVENNLSSLKEIKNNLNEYQNYSIINKDINKLNLRKKFDYVIMENVIQGLSNAKEIFSKVSSFLKPGGSLIITLCDNVAMLSEKLRYLQSLIILQNHKEKNFLEKTILLSKVFDSHLSTLNTSTRSSAKWVQDNILHYNWMQKNNYFSFIDMFPLLKKNELLVKQCSPDFNNDYSWYKKFEVNKHNKNFLLNYKIQRLNFLDFEEKISCSEDKLPNYIEIVDQILRINFLISKTTASDLKKGEITKISEKIDDLSDNLEELKEKNKISKALKEFSKFLRNYLNNDNYSNKLTTFKSFWGLATNQISFIKNI